MTDNAPPAAAPIAPLASGGMAAPAPPASSGVVAEAHVAAMPRAAVEAAIKANVKNADFSRRFASGDTAARSEMDMLHRALAKHDGAPAQSAPTNADGQAQQAAIDPAAAALIEAGTTPPESPAAYDLGRTEGDMTPQMRQADTILRQFLVDANVPAEIGTAAAKIANTMHREFQKVHPEGWSGLSEDARANHTDATVAHLRKLWGGEYDNNVRAAQQLVAEIDKKQGGRVSRYLEQTGLCSNLNFIVLAHQHAQRLAARGDMGMKK